MNNSNNGSTTYEDIVGKLEVIWPNMAKKASDDAAALTRTKPMEVGKVPPVEEDYDDEALRKGEAQIETTRKAALKPNPGGEGLGKSVDGEEPKKPSASTKLAKAKSAIEKLRALINASGSTKKAGSNDMMKKMKVLLKNAEEAMTEDEVEYDEDGNPIEKETEEETNDESINIEDLLDDEETKEAAAAGKYLAEMVYIIKNAQEIKDYVVKEANDAQAIRKQDEALAAQVGEYVEKLERSYDELNKAYIKQANDLQLLATHIQSMEKSGSANKANMPNIDEDAKQAAIEAYNQVLLEKKAVEKRGANYSYVKSQMLIDEIKAGQKQSPDFQ